MSKRDVRLCFVLILALIIIFTSCFPVLGQEKSIYDYCGNSRIDANEECDGVLIENCYGTLQSYVDEEIDPGKVSCSADCKCLYDGKTTKQIDLEVYEKKLKEKTSQAIDMEKLKELFAWQKIKEIFGGGVDFTSNKIRWFFGAVNWDGEEIHIFSGNFWTSVALGYFWRGLLAVAGLFLFLVIYSVGGPKKEILFGYGERKVPYSWRLKRNLKERWIRIFIILPIVYPLLMGIPVINRVVQIITFEVLMPDSLIIRSLILAIYVGVLPEIFKRYFRYKERQEKYETKLKEEVGRRTAEEMATA